MATDPKRAEAVFVAYLGSPQQWNRYCYVTNNPLKYVDPFGEKIEIFGNEDERKKALERIKGVVGEEGAKQLYVREENGHYYVEARDLAALTDTGETGFRIALLIGTEQTTEFHIATTFQVKVSEWFGLSTRVRTRSVASFGGAATVGAEESLNGNTQIYVHPNAADYANDVLGATVLGATRSNDGKPLTFYNDIVDAHEFGHAFANVILRTKIGETYPWALRLENAVRERRKMPNRRVRE